MKEENYLEITEEDDFEKDYKEIYNLVDSHFKKEGYKKEEFYFSRLMVEYNILTVIYINNKNENLSYYYEAYLEEVLQGEYSFDED